MCTNELQYELYNCMYNLLEIWYTVYNSQTHIHVVVGIKVKVRCVCVEGGGGGGGRERENVGLPVTDNCVI